MEDFIIKKISNFVIMPRGALMETKTFLVKSVRRNLIPQNVFDVIFEKSGLLNRKLNEYIKRLEIQITNDQPTLKLHCMKRFVKCGFGWQAND